jgi:hypothetical protein
MNDRLPPNSIETESASLACLLLAPEQARQMLPKLRKTYFYDLRHQVIFTAISCLVAEGKAPDSVALYQWLMDKKHLEDAGGLDYVVRLPETAPSAANFESYLPTLKDKAARRELLRLSTQATKMAYGESRDPKGLAFEFIQLSAQIAASSMEPREWFHFYSPTECRNFSPPQGLVLVGDCHITRGAVTVIAGPPGVGKSRAGHALAVAGATLADWFGLKVHQQFRTAIIQN